jgi:hypothetical protein
MARLSAGGTLGKAILACFADRRDDENAIFKRILDPRLAVVDVGVTSFCRGK